MNGLVSRTICAKEAWQHARHAKTARVNDSARGRDTWAMAWGANARATRTWGGGEFGHEGPLGTSCGLAEGGHGRLDSLAGMASCFSARNFSTSMNPSGTWYFQVVSELLGDSIMVDMGGGDHTGPSRYRRTGRCVALFPLDEANL